MHISGAPFTVTFPSPFNNCHRNGRTTDHCHSLGCTESGSRCPDACGCTKVKSVSEHEVGFSSCRAKDVC